MKNIRLGIVVSRFNSEYTDKLLTGALETLREEGIEDKQLEIVKVPGAFEIPITAKHLIEEGAFDAIIALGAVIKGDTYHYELVCDQTAAGIQRVSLDTGVPVIFGVITCETDEQAEARTGGSQGNKGVDAALAALEMIKILK